ncbi:MAG: 16S rRNA (guanine(966)-N(2))-methyltransferase RsmD [Paracoccaceae bacterium]
MRIVGGSRRGLRLAEVGAGDAAAHLRPTSERVREAIFNLLLNGGYGNPVGGARVLDLFAGTGGLGLEALSRGAKSLTLIDNGAVARRLLARNIALMQEEARASILARDALQLGQNPGEVYDLIFLDPPYGKSLGEKALAECRKGGWISDEALIVWEENQPPEAPPWARLLDQRSYGGTVVSILSVDLNDRAGSR